MKASSLKQVMQMPERCEVDAGTSGLIGIRSASASDAVALLPLISAHAEYEQCKMSATLASLQAALSRSPPLLCIWIAEVDGELIGYASTTLEFSTWSGCQFVHLDCLFVREVFRGNEVGSRLLGSVRNYAAAIGIDEVQWQTPAWNEDACRFYLRQGATALPKIRFTLATTNSLTGAPTARLDHHSSLESVE